MEAIDGGCVVFDIGNPEMVLLIRGHPDDPNYVSLPKGMVENNKSLQETALEETRSETGYNVNPALKFVGTTQYPRIIEGIKTQKTVHWFKTDVDSLQERGATDDECDDVIWAKWLVALGLLTYLNDKGILFNAVRMQYEEIENGN